MGNKETYFWDADKVAQRAAEDCRAYLESKGLIVSDVQDNDFYKKLDIDFVVVDPQTKAVNWIELKGDAQEKYGNFFMEYISNDTINSQGCMLATRSHYVFYYFVNTRTLHIFDTKEMQEWLRNTLDKQPNRFKDGITGTCDKTGKQGWYKTIGKRVPVRTLKSEIFIDTKII